MCEIFPEVNSCCFLVPIRIALIFIAVLAITTGTVAQSLLIKKTNVNYDELHQGIKNLTTTRKYMDGMQTIVRTGISVGSMLFMFIGVVLLIANLTDSRDTAWLFVWGILLIVIIGVLVVCCVMVECIVKEDDCLVSDMDWFSSGCFMVMTLAYLFIWLYFAAIANTYSVN